MEKYEQSLEKFEELFVEQQLKMLMSNKNEDLVVFSWDAILNAITEFNYIAEAAVNSSSYFRTYEDLYKTDCENWSDNKRVRLGLRKQGAVTYTKIVYYILPKKQQLVT